MRTALVAFGVLAAMSGTARAQWLNYPTPGIPRLPNGAPNLSAPAPRAANGKPRYAPAAGTAQPVEPIEVTMKRSHRRLAVLLTSASVGLSSILSALPSVYPTGTTIFKPDKTWSGYTVFITPDSDGVVLMDQAPGTKNQGPMPSRS